MSDNAPKPALKSAYELALERLETQGIDRPRDDGLSDAAKAAVAEARSRAEAALAQLEILHNESMSGSMPPSDRATAREEYQRERRRIEERRDREIAKARQDA